MREIKFRAWSNENEEMLDDVGTWTDDFTDMLNRTIKYLQEDAEDKLILMQYTGLKDKNGKEIYEGDILSAEMDDGNQHGFVDYMDGGFGFSYKDRYGSGTGCDLCFVAGDSCEIMGNIHENPELLNNQTQ